MGDKEITEKIEGLLRMSEELKAKGEKELAKQFKDCATKMLDVIYWSHQRRR